MKKHRYKVSKLVKRARRKDEVKQADNSPRITNASIEEHREEVLSSARKHIVPLAHSRHRIVVTSIWLIVVVLFGFLAYCGLALYKFQSSSSFIYGVTRVIPFPAAKVGSDYVSYENYLFELRHYEHYYRTQQRVDFGSKSGERQMASFKKQALQQVIDNAYIKQLAAANHVTVSSQDVNDEISLVRSQNRLGSSDQVFKDALQNFWGWSVSDFRREIRQQLLAEKVVAKLDKGTNQRAEQALAKLSHGAKFGKLAAKVSDDTSAKKNNGEYSGWIDQSNRDIAPQVTAQLSKLKAGQHSGIINTGYSLEIVKVIEKKGTKVRAAHISFNLNSINTYIGPLKSHEPVHRYINV